MSEKQIKIKLFGTEFDKSTVIFGGLFIVFIIICIVLAIVYPPKKSPCLATEEEKKKCQSYGVSTLCNLSPSKCMWVGTTNFGSCKPTNCL